ncbi:MAG: hypothetical protein NW201_09705 [Gemmatimonadales bacterium]|nr:hypothetical protein [Gemmatimonadales bacterium]
MSRSRSFLAHIALLSLAAAPAHAQWVQRISVVPSLVQGGTGGLTGGARLGVCAARCEQSTSMWLAFDGGFGYERTALLAVPQGAVVPDRRLTSDNTYALTGFMQRQVYAEGGWLLTAQAGPTVGVVRREERIVSLGPGIGAITPPDRSTSWVAGGFVGFAVSRRVSNAAVGVLLRLDVLSTGVRVPIGVQLSF